MAPTPSFCAEKNRLMDAFLAASYEVIKLQNKEAVEIARGGEGLAQFEVALKPYAELGPPNFGCGRLGGVARTLPVALTHTAP